MKRNLLLLICVMFLGLAAQAQIIFEQTFDDGIEPMTMVDNDGNTPFTNVASYTEAWNIRNSDFGPAAVSNSWYNPAGTADDWLITPSLDISEDGFILYWNARAVDPMFPDGYEVLVSTTDNELASFTDVVFSTDAEATTWQNRTFGLDDYVGESIYIAIRNNSNDKFLLIVDNIVVAKLKQNDVFARSMTNKRWNDINTNVNPSFEIRNLGSDNLTEVTVNYTFDGNDYNETVTGLNLAPLEIGEITLNGNVSMANGTEYILDFDLTSPNGTLDEDLTNNASIGKLNGMSEFTDRKVVAEEGTGTWCPWCPRGEVFMKYMYDTYPDFIGIAVHNRDPMTITEYDGNAGFSSYPSAHVNRVDRNFNPDQFEARYLAQLEVNTPVSAEMTLDYNEDTREITVTGASLMKTDATGADLRFALVLVLDGMSGTSSDWAQANNYAGGGEGPMGGYEDLPNPVPASQMVYDHVGQVLVDGFYGVEGSIPADFTSSDAATHTFKYTLPLAMAPMKTTAVLMVLDNDTGEILNADKAYVQTPVGLFETATEIEATVYPNPVSDFAQVELNLEKATAVNITVLDMMGRTVAARTYDKVQGKMIFPINVTRFNDGMYTVQISTEEGATTRRIMVAK